MIRIFAIVFSLLLFGCPPEEGCQKIMECQDDQEMVCDKNDSGCGEDCHYYVVEHCYEVCR